MQQLSLYAVGAEPIQRGPRTVRPEQIEHAVRQVRPVLAGFEELCVDRLDVRCAPQRGDVGIDETRMFSDAVGGFEDDVEMIEAPEVAKECLEARNRTRPLRQETQDVRVERHARDQPCADERRADRRKNDQPCVSACEQEHGGHRLAAHALDQPQVG